MARRATVGILLRNRDPLNKSNARRAFNRLLKRADLPAHFSPHCLRHTFASVLLQQGESPVYVQRQLGHASIKLTVDTYGNWLPMGTRPRWTGWMRGTVAKW